MLWVVSTAVRVQEVSGPLQMVQSLAVMEVVHAVMGLVRSPVFTTAQQVASRLFIVWGILNAAPKSTTEGALELLSYALLLHTVPSTNSILVHVIQ